MSYIKYAIIVCLSLFSSILSPFQTVSYLKCMVIVCLTIFFNLATISGCELHKCMIIVFDYFLNNLVPISVCELHKVQDYCVFDHFLFNHVTIINF